MYVERDMKMKLKLKPLTHEIKLFMYHHECLIPAHNIRFGHITEQEYAKQIIKLYKEVVMQK